MLNLKSYILKHEPWTLNLKPYQFYPESFSVKENLNSKTPKIPHNTLNCEHYIVNLNFQILKPETLINLNPKP